MNGLTATSAGTSGFTLSLATLKEWNASRQPSPLEHLDSFEGSRPHPLTNDHFYPGLSRIASQTSLRKLDPTAVGDPLLQGITVAGPILGIAGASLLMLVKDGAFRAHLIEQGEVRSLSVKSQEGSKTSCQVELPDGRQVGFYRGINGASGLSISTTNDQGATVSANFWDVQQQQPRLSNVTAETVDVSAGQSDTRRVSLNISDSNQREVKLSREVTISDCEGGFRQELNSSHCFATSDLGGSGSYVSPPSSEEMYLVAHSVMGRLPA